MASVIGDKGLSQCWSEPVSAGSNMGWLLVKAEHISNASSISMTTLFKKG